MVFLFTVANDSAICKENWVEINYVLRHRNQDIIKVVLDIGFAGPLWIFLPLSFLMPQNIKNIYYEESGEFASYYVGVDT
ncbi:MAG: hypothetical protein MK188_06260 [Gammaproteobacteria bacterium]|nr:hypothetical protein [Gammaproteobacteria bacterium]